MSENPQTYTEIRLQTYTEIRRDQRRIEVLEAELAHARQQLDELASAYTDLLDALAEANWHAAGVILQHALWAMAGSMVTIVAFRWLA